MIVRFDLSFLFYFALRRNVSNAVEKNFSPFAIPLWVNFNIYIFIYFNLILWPTLLYSFPCKILRYKFSIDSCLKIFSDFRLSINFKFTIFQNYVENSYSLQGTICPASNFNAEKIATKMRKAMRGIGMILWYIYDEIDLKLTHTGWFSHTTVLLTMFVCLMNVQWLVHKNQH